VEHLPRFFVVLVIDPGPQPAGEQPQCLLGHRRVEREHLQGRDDAVASKQCCVPREPGGEVALVVEARGEQPQVEQRATKDAVEHIIVDLDAGTIGEPCVRFSSSGGCRPARTAPGSAIRSRSRIAVLLCQLEACL
jgi:hypothetical protein